jgi:hypothetical protein
MIRIFDRKGIPLGEINALYTCSWLLNGPGRMSFSLSVKDPKCREDLLRFGNLVLIQHDTLPDWGGVIDTPREWGSGNVRVNAWSGEKLLEFRRGTPGKVVTGSGGAIFAQIIRQANTVGNLPLVVGNVYEGGKVRTETLNDTLLIETTRIVEQAKMEWYVEPDLLGDGRLIFRANCLVKTGKQLSLELEESVHLKLSNRPMTEQGEIINDVLGYGEGVNWQSKPTAIRKDDTSIGSYGLRQGLYQFSGVTTGGTLESNTSNYLQQMSEPRVSMDVDVADVNDIWKYMRLGNRFNARLHSVGFTGGTFGIVQEIRALGMEYDGSTLRIVGES